MKGQPTFVNYIFSAIGIAFFILVASCGGGGSSNTDTYTCPAWNVGNTMTYRHTETINDVPSESTTTYTVITHTAGDTVELSDGTTLKTYSISGDEYIPATEGPVGSSTPDTYTSPTPFCPPPDVGASYEYTTWIPSSAGRGGDYYPVSLTVTSEAVEDITVPAGSLKALKLVMAKTDNTQTPPVTSTVTRYYVSDIGVVKEVEATPSTNTVVTDELLSYIY